MQKLSKAQRMELFGRLVATKEGRHRLAATLTMPLRTERDYFSIGRKIIFAEDLPDGAYPIYDKDPFVRAFYISETGEEVASILHPNTVAFPLFEIVSAPKIPITQIQDRRYDLVTRAKDKGRSEINHKEDERVFAVLEAAATDASNPNATGAAFFTDTRDKLAAAFAEIESRDLLVHTIAMHPATYRGIRQFTDADFDRETQREVFRTGILGYMWGAQIVVSTEAPSDRVLIMAEPETVGRMPIRSDIVVLSNDDPDNRMIGFSMFERLGIGVHNLQAVADITVA